MGYSVCKGWPGDGKLHGRTCDHCDQCRHSGVRITRVTVSGFGLAGYYCPEHTPAARQWARDYIAAHGFSEVFR